MEGVQVFRDIKEAVKGKDIICTDSLSVDMVDIVCCVNHIHFICPLFIDFLKAFQFSRVSGDFNNKI